LIKYEEYLDKIIEINDSLWLYPLPFEQIDIQILEKKLEELKSNLKKKKRMSLT
jgi:hypothetical protein